jgi:outer membrane protein assembly factor BamB
MVFFFAVFVVNAFAEEISHDPVIPTPPAVDEGIIYIVHWPDAVYAFDEATNSVRWTGLFEPALDTTDFDLNSLPAPAPTPIRSCVLVHLGNQLWAVSKIDGRLEWSVDNLPPSSEFTATHSSNTLPGYYALDIGADGAVFTLEFRDDGSWRCCRRLLGDGSVQWETNMGAGIPKGWWVDRDGIYIACENQIPDEVVGEPVTPAFVYKFDPESGKTLFVSDIAMDSSYRSSFIASGRIYLLEKLTTGDFRVRAFKLDTGELYDEITYSAGDFIDALQSDDKLIFLHKEISGEEDTVRFQLYYSSLNAIRSQTLREPRSDQPFSKPDVVGNLFLCGGAAYSLYDGNIVWQYLEQMSLVDWTHDDNNLYLWDASGNLLCWDRLTGSEVWKTPFNPMDTTHIGGESLSLIDGRLFATTQSGDLVRINPDTGEPHPGVIRITTTANGSTGNQPNQDGNNSYFWIWIVLALIIVAAGLITWLGHKPRPSRHRPHAE